MAGACRVLTACGGGGSGTDGNAVTQLGLVKLTVNDSFGTPVAGAQVHGPRETSMTDAKGVALVTLSAADSSATVTLSSTSFNDQSVTVDSSGGKVKDVAITLQRKASAAGGSLASRGSDLPVLSADGRQLTFDVEVVVVGADAGPVEHLGAADFRLRACTPAALIGGNTPLYDSLDSLRRQVVGDSALAVGKSKAVVVFSDGADTSCASPEACRSRRASSIANARQDQIRIFTIGLSNGVDVVAMAELAHQSGGAFL